MDELTVTPNILDVWQGCRAGGFNLSSVLPIVEKLQTKRIS